MSLYTRPSRSNSLCSNYDEAPPAYSSYPTRFDISLSYPIFYISKWEGNTWKITDHAKKPLYQVNFASKGIALLADLTNLTLGSIHLKSTLTRRYQLDLELPLIMNNNELPIKSSVKIQLPTLLRSSCRILITSNEEETAYHWQFRSLAQWYLIQKTCPPTKLATYLDTNGCGGNIQFHTLLPPLHARLLTLAMTFIRQNF